MSKENHSVEEDQPVEAAVIPKFDMPCYESSMSPKDVKSLTLRYGIPLDLHPCAPYEGWTMDQLPEEVIVNRGTGFLLRRGRAIPDAMPWRHHDSDVNDTVPEDGFNALNVQKLTERFIDLRPVPIGLLLRGGLATTWDFSGFHPIFKESERNVVTMSEYLCFLFLFVASIVQGTTFSSGYLKESKKRGADEGEGSKPKIKRKKVLAAKKAGRLSLSMFLLLLPSKQWGLPADHSAHHSPVAERILYLPRTILHAWFNLARWAMAQTDILERFKNLQDDYDMLIETHAECSETVRKLVTARVDLEHNAKLYNDKTNRYKRVKEDHDGCDNRLQVLEK
nr:hypothetical protein [Tanacetum cinerariifolium]